MLLMAFPACASAGPLIGGQFAVQSMVRDWGPEHLDFRSQSIQRTISAGVEIPSIRAARSLAAAGVVERAHKKQNHLKIADAAIDVSETGIVISYAKTKGAWYVTAQFAGYVFSFPGAAKLAYASSCLDQSLRLLGMTERNLRVSNTTIYLNLAGLRANRTSRICILFDCSPPPSA